MVVLSQVFSEVVRLRATCGLQFPVKNELFFFQADFTGSGAQF